MITRVGILQKARHLSREEFSKYWTEVHGPIAAKHIPGLLQYHQNQVIDAMQRGIDYPKVNHEIDGFSQLWFESTDSMQSSFKPEVLAILDEDEKQFIGQLSLFTVEQNIVVPKSENKNLIKRMSIIKRHPSIDEETFKKEWKEVHANYVKALPGIQGYIQNHIIDRSIKRKSSVALTEAAIDGVVEMWFEDVESLEKAFRSDVGVECMKHAETFIAEISTFLVNNRVIKNI